MAWKINYLTQIGKLSAMHKSVGMKINDLKKQSKITSTVIGAIASLMTTVLLLHSNGIAEFNMKAIGVVLMSLIIGFLFYILSSNPKEQEKNLAQLHKLLGKKLVKIRINPDKFNYDEFKNLEISYVGAKLAIPSDKEIGRAKYRFWNEIIKTP